MRIYYQIVCLLLVFMTSIATADRIHDMVQKGDIKEVQKLLAVSPEMVNLADSSGRMPLHVAATYGQREIAILLLNKGAKIDAPNENNFYKGTTPLLAAIDQDRTEMAFLLIGKGADVNVSCKIFARGNGFTPLHIAAWKCNTRVVKVLLDKGASVDAISDDEDTPLNAMVRNYSYGLKESEITLTVRLLINAKADVTKSNKHGWTPLHQATQKGLFDVCGTLISAGADVNAQDEKRVRPLTLAVKNGDVKIIKLLKDKGATE